MPLSPAAEAAIARIRAAGITVNAPPEPWSLQHFQQLAIEHPSQPHYAQIAAAMQRTGATRSYHLYGHTRPITKSTSVAFREFFTNPGVLMFLGAAGAAIAGGAAAAGAAGGASAATGATPLMPAAVAPASAGFTAAAWPSGGTLFTLADAAAAAPAFTGASAMNFSSLFRDLGQQAISGMLTQTISGLTGSSPQPIPLMPTQPQPQWNMMPGAQAPVGFGGGFGGGGAAPGMEGVQLAAFPAIIGGAANLIRGGAGLVGGAIAGAVGIVRSVGGKIMRVILPGGRSISRAKAVQLAKRVGLEAAAVALGISAVEMAQMIMDDTTTTRRRGGITAAQLRTTRRTMGKVKRMHAQIAGYCSTAGYRSRRSSRSSTRGNGRGGLPLIVNQG